MVGPNGEEEEVSMGNPEQVHAVLNSWGYKGASDFVPKPKPTARKKKLPDEDQPAFDFHSKEKPGLPPQS